jgi:hypothetical protein
LFGCGVDVLHEVERVETQVVEAWNLLILLFQLVFWLETLRLTHNLLYKSEVAAFSTVKFVLGVERLEISVVWLTWYLLLRLVVDEVGGVLLPDHVVIHLPRHV